MKKTETILLNKMAEYITLNNIERNELSEKMASVLEKEAQLIQEIETFKVSITKIADVLFQEDFLTGDTEKDRFVKRAQEDKDYLASFVKRVCKSASVSVMGSPARVAVKNASESTDPIMRRAGLAGGGYGSVITDLD